MERKKIALIFGGCSTEYEVSLQSAYAVFKNIDGKKFQGKSKERKLRQRTELKNKGQLKDKTAKFKDFKKIKSRKSNLQKDLREMKMVEIRGFECAEWLWV